MSNRINELRQLRNMTLLQVADKLGVSESTVQRYESGAIANLKYDTIVNLAKVFDVEPAYLMGWDDLSSASVIPDVDALFIEKYGERTYNAAMKYNVLDDTDKARIDERMDTILESPKYQQEIREKMDTDTSSMTA